MKRTDISAMAAALRQVAEGKSEKVMDDCDDTEKKPMKKKVSSGKGKTEVETQVQEEVEELDELSNKTLGSYVKKAKDSYAGASADMTRTSTGHQDPARKKTINKFINRNRGIDKAVDKMTKESMSPLARYKKMVAEASGQEPMKKVSGPAQSIQSPKNIDQSKESSPTKDTGKLDKQSKPEIVDGKKAIEDNKQVEKKSSEKAASPKTADVKESRFGTPTNIDNRKPISVRDALAMMEENERAKHTKGATAPQEYDDKWSKSAKDWADVHELDEVEAADINKVVEKNKEEVGLSLQRTVNYRHNDQKIGDKTQPGAKK